MGEKAEKIMREMGFEPTDNGVYVSELRALIERKVSRGLQRRSHGTWATDELSTEERAREILAVEWEIDNGHTVRIECIDGAFGWRTDLETMKRYLFIDWKSLPSWIGDRYRLAVGDVRVWWDRKILRRKNPWVRS